MEDKRFFEQNGNKYFCSIYGGYAIKYTRNTLCGFEYIQFETEILMADDPQNLRKPTPTDLVSECLVALAKNEGRIMAEIYGRLFPVEEKDTVYEIKRRIRNIQLSLFHVDQSIASDVAKHIQEGLDELVRNMPVH